MRPTTVRTTTFTVKKRMGHNLKILAVTPAQNATLRKTLAFCALARVTAYCALAESTAEADDKGTAKKC